MDRVNSLLHSVMASLTEKAIMDQIYTLNFVHATSSLFEVIG